MSPTSDSSIDDPPVIRTDLHPQATVHHEPGNGYRVEIFGRTHRFFPDSPEVDTAVRAVLVEGVSPSTAQQMVQTSGTPVPDAPWHDFLERLSDGVLICRTVYDGDAPLATLVPLSNQFEYVPEAVEPTTRIHLSRFAHVRRCDREFELHMPFSGAKIELRDPQAMVVLAALDEPRTVGEIVRRCATVSASAVEGMVDFLSATRAISRVRPDGPSEEDLRFPFPWEFHDLLTHSATRAPKIGGSAGIAYRFGEVDDNPFNDPYASLKVLDTVVLEVPTDDDLAGDALPFVEVLKARRSQRDHSPEPITRRELGAFLYRVFNPRTEITVMGVTQELRPYPSGGAIYELDPWVVVNRCEDLDPGLYRYDIQAHALARITDHGESVSAIVARVAGGASSNPFSCNTGLLFVGCLPQFAYKYTPIAYTVMLKNVGALMAHCCLVATTMGLAICPIGAGASEEFAEATGLDLNMATPVGEMILGRPADPA